MAARKKSAVKRLSGERNLGKRSGASGKLYGGGQRGSAMYGGANQIAVPGIARKTATGLKSTREVKPSKVKITGQRATKFVPRGRQASRVGTPSRMNNAQIQFLSRGRGAGFAMKRTGAVKLAQG
jgi:hypothetical protein